MASPATSAQQRSGLSRVDALFVIVAIGLVSGTLLPALPTAREMARQRMCRANLARIGAALQTYRDAQGVFPPAAFWTGEHIDVARFRHVERLPEISHANWVQLILPHIGEDRLAFEFDQLVPITDPRNAKARTTELTLFKCPSDSNGTSPNQAAYALADGTMTAFARGNYAINGGVTYLNDTPGWLWDPHPWGYMCRVNTQSREFQWLGNGVAGYNASVALNDIRNGLSTTVAVDEIRTGIAPIDLRGVWALGVTGASVTWAHGLYGDADGPNSQWPYADDSIGCKKLYNQLGSAMVQGARMPCCDHCLEGQQATARSEHPDGVHVLMLDGSVHFVGDLIHPELWHVMHSRDVPAGVFPDDFERQLTDPSAVAEAPPFRASSTEPSSEQAATHPVVNSIGMKFTPIPSGEFMMGLPDKAPLAPAPAEVPPHLIRITRPFLIGTYEVTQHEFEWVMHSNPSWHSQTGGGRQTVASRDTAKFPVENVTWDEASEFCRRLSAQSAERTAGRSYRLPTEAEWEYVCRSGSKEPRDHNAKWLPNDPSGEFAMKERKRINGVVQLITTAPVGSYRPNEFGVYDMRGNVWEWCRDWFARDYYSHSPTDDPQGPATGYLRVWRGIDWVFTSNNCNTSRLWGLEPWVRNPYLGFRVVCMTSSSPTSP